MNTKFISSKALTIIDQYKNFQIGNAICSIPYYNNKISTVRAGLRVNIGKGSAKDIYDEIERLSIIQKFDIKSFNNDNLKKFLVDNNIGIDCSAFAYYVLEAESIDRGKGNLDKILSFPFCKGLFGSIKSKLRPVENASVETFAHEKNSRIINIKDISVGDMIIILGNKEGNDRNHILIINQIEYQNFIPTNIHYVHAIAWPTNGKYDTGIHEGEIEIKDINKSIIEQNWIENNAIGNENYTFSKALDGKTNIYRLNHF